MKIAFFTENPFYGTPNKGHKNMRTDMAWLVGLDAVNVPIHHLSDQFCEEQDLKENSFDIGIVIIPKTHVSKIWKRLGEDSLINKLCSKVGYMQEGPNWYWQNWSAIDQINYINTLTDADFILCHNEEDQVYYTGLIPDVPIRILPSLMVDSALEYIINPLSPEERSNIILGGTFCSWYGGMDSFVVASSVDGGDIYAPSMGRKGDDEALVQGIEFLPYLEWLNWIKTLNNFKYGIHLMRTYAAGTFALNCAYLGIPCIGYESLDTQRKCHPNLTVKEGDLSTARLFLNKLNSDPGFYREQSAIAKENYNTYFSEKVFRKKMKYVLKNLDHSPSDYMLDYF